MKTQKPNAIDMYALGIIKIGHDTRELNVGGTANPLTNETMLFQTLAGEMFSEYLGLLQFPVMPGEHPGNIFARKIYDLFEIKIERKLEYKCAASELTYAPGRIIHNIYHIFSQRLAHMPRIKNSNISIEPIKQSKIHDQRHNFHPTHYEILKQMVLTNRKLTDTKPKSLEIELEQCRIDNEEERKYFKINSTMWI